MLDRVARLADGWLPESRPPEGVAPQLEKLRGLLESHGRDPGAFGLQARLSLRDGDPDHWRRCYAWYLENGFTHFAVATIWCGASTLDEHLAALQRFCDEVGVLQ